MITLNMVNEDNTVEQIEVSEETLELYIARAKAIYEQANTAEECIELIEQASTDDKVRSIIAEIIVTIQKEREMQQMLRQQMLMQVLKQVLKQVSGQ